MNKFVKLGAAAGLLLALLGSIAPNAYAADAPSENAFVIALPAGYAPFAEQVQTAKSPEGDITTTTWVSKAPTGEAVVVTRSRMPGRILDPQKLITSTRASLLTSLGATLESEEPRPGELPSMRLTFRSDAAVFRARFTVVDDRLYQLLYVGRSQEQREAAEVGRLFESFAITEAAAPAVAAQQ